MRPGGGGARGPVRSAELSPTGPVPPGPAALLVADGFAAAPDVLPFTPPSTTLEALGDIAAHLSSVASMPGHAPFFAHQGAATATSADFLRAYVTTVPAVAESAWQASMSSGIPIVCTPKPTDVQAQAAAHLRGALGGLAPP